MIASAKKSTNVIIVVILSLLAVLFMIPMILVLINSFKSKFFISIEPFALPNSETFVGIENYIKGLTSSGFFAAPTTADGTHAIFIAMELERRNGQGTIVAAYFYRIPLFLRSAVYYGIHFVATIENKTANGSNTVRNSNAG